MARALLSSDFVTKQEQRSRLSRLCVGLLRDVEEVRLTALASAAAELTRAPTALIQVMLERRRVFVVSHGLPEERELVGGGSVHAMLAERVVSSKSAVLLGDVRSEVPSSRAPYSATAIGAFAGVPIRLGDEVIGTLSVIDVFPRKFSAATQVQLGALANEAARWLESRTLVETSQATPRKPGTSGSEASVVRVMGDLTQALELLVLALEDVASTQATSWSLASERADEALLCHAETTESLAMLAGLFAEHPDSDAIEHVTDELAFVHGALTDLRPRLRVLHAVSSGSASGITKWLAAMPAVGEIEQALRGATARILRGAELSGVRSLLDRRSV